MPNSSRLSALCDKIIEAGWLAAVVLVPLFFNIYSSRVFEPDKLTLLRSIALVMSAAWIVRTIEERFAPGESGANGRRSLTHGVNLRIPLILPTLVLVVVYIIATVLSIVPRTSLFGSYQRLQGTYTTFSYIVIFLMILQGMRRRRQLDRLVTAVVMTSMPIAFYGLLQHGDGTTTLDPLPWGGIVTARVASNMGNAIFVAAYLIMAFFLTLGRVVEAFRVILSEAESRWSDILRASAYIFVGAVQLIAFSFANSRGPLLGWLPGMFIFGLVGLLTLRVTLHRAGTPAEPASSEAAPASLPTPNLLSEGDVLKALVLSISSIIVAGAAGLLAYSAFPGTPQVTLAAVVALIGGLVPLLFVAAARRPAARWVWAGWIFFSIVGAVGLFLVNFSDHPKMIELRQTGRFGTLGTLFESEGGTGKVRSLIWEGSAKLVQPHDPLIFPDGTTDSLNPIRLLIGYGPESMYVAYNRFYPPDLAHYEARNASPDRSHNETWDSLVITGAIGFVAEQFLFISIFFFALKFIGWVPSRKAAITFVGMMIVGGIAGAIGLGIVKHVNFMGVGWPGGVTGGLVLYVILFALFHFQISTRVYAFIAVVLIAIVDLAIFLATFTSANRLIEMLATTGGAVVGFAILFFIARWAFEETAGQPIPVSGHIFLIIALFGGILAHYLEISLAGIAIAATRTYFWIFAGVLVVTGLNWVPADDAESAPIPEPRVAAPAKTPPANAATSKKKKAAARPAPRPSITRPASGWLGPTIALALVGALILATLGFEFIATPPIAKPEDVPQGITPLIWNALTRLPYQDNRQSPGTLLMFLVTWAFGAVISLTELRRREVIKPDTQLRATAVYAGVSLGVAFLYWMFHAGRLLDVLGLVLKLNTGQAANVNEFLNRFVALAESMAGMLGLFYVFVFTLIALIGTSLIRETRVQSLPAASEWGIIGSAPIFIGAVVLLIVTNFNPIRADIIFKQGQPYIANNACNGANGQCEVAIAHLKEALKYAPDEDFYMLSLGASFLNKSSSAPDAEQLLVEGSSYESIINLDGQQTTRLGRRDALTAARITLEHARQINPLNTDHSANLARLHRRWSDLAADDTERQLRLDQAGNYYREATTLSPQNAQLWNEWAVVFFGVYDIANRLGNTDAAAAALQQAQTRLDESLRLDDKFAETYLYLSSLQAALGKTAEAEASLRQMLQLDPDSPDAWGRLTEQDLATNNITDAEKITVDFVNRHPTFLTGWRYLARRIYFPQGRLAEAIDAARHAVELSGTDAGRWEDLLALAEMLRLTGNTSDALNYAQQALQAAPQDNKADAQKVIDAIQGTLKVTPQPTPTP